jgi:hypothetical protein
MFYKRGTGTLNGLLVVISLCIGTVLLSACETLPQRPAFSSGLQFELLTRYPNESEKAAQYSVPNSHFGIVREKGIGPIGLLLVGGLGTVVNQSYLESKSKESSSGLQAVVLLNLADSLSKVEFSNSTSHNSNSNVDRVQLLPIGLLNMIDDESFSFSCTIRPQFVKEGQTIWWGRYRSNWDTIFNTKSTTLVADVSKASDECFKRIFALLQDQLTNKPMIWRDAHVELASFGIDVPVLESKLPERVVTRDLLGIMEYGKGQVIKLDLK